MKINVNKEKENRVQSAVRQQSWGGSKAYRKSNECREAPIVLLVVEDVAHESAYRAIFGVDVLRDWRIGGRLRVEWSLRDQPNLRLAVTRPPAAQNHQSEVSTGKSQLREQNSWHQVINFRNERLFAVAVALHENAEELRVLTGRRIRLHPRRDQHLPLDAAHNNVTVRQHRLVRVVVLEEPVFKAFCAPSTKQKQKAKMQEQKQRLFDSLKQTRNQSSST